VGENKKQVGRAAANLGCSSGQPGAAAAKPLTRCGAKQTPAGVWLAELALGLVVVAFQTCP